MQLKPADKTNNLSIGANGFCVIHIDYLQKISKVPSLVRATEQYIWMI